MVDREPFDMDHLRETETAAKKAALETWSPIVELRQYTLHPGKRDLLIELFDREFVESQEALGMKVIGQFRTPDDPDRFIWLRGFPDMATRARALQAFYDGPAWKLHRDVANAAMMDSDNVLLLRPARPGSGFVLEGERPSPRSKLPAGLVVATIYHLDESQAADFTVFFTRALEPVLAEAGASVLAVLVSENAPNNFPRLPIREGEHVLVCFTAFADELGYQRQQAELARKTVWAQLARELGPGLQREAQTWRLRPTARSLVTGRRAIGRQRRKR